MAERKVVWLSEGKPRTPPVGAEARQSMGALLRLAQQGVKLAMPHSRPMPSVGAACHELRVRDGETRLTWRLVYRIDADAIVVVHWWAKKTQQTTRRDLELCRRRLARYDKDAAR